VNVKVTEDEDPIAEGFGVPATLKN